MQKISNDFLHVKYARNRRRYALVPQCSICGDTEELPLSAKPTLTQDTAENLVRNAGWSLGSTRRKDKCPSCAGVHKSELKRIQASAAVQPTMADVMPPAVISMLSPPASFPASKVMPGTDPTPIASQLDPIVAPAVDPLAGLDRITRQLILIELDRTYITDKCYRDDWSDAKLADVLGRQSGGARIEEAAVAALREQIYGAEESNEATLAHAETLARLREERLDLEAEILRLTTRMRQVDAELAELHPAARAA